MIGERIGHLRVIASIGVGGMGAVWHAVDELLDRHVALKVIRPELMSRPGLAERFRSEAIVLARLQHPCIAALYGLEKRGEEFVMVMEFVDGETLDTRLHAEGSLPWPEATRITRAVLDALDHAHESGVIHRDIKPANVMITRAGRVKVMDFGIARLVGAQRQTRTGAAVGTPSYMSPEQLLGQEVDGRADVYAVGTLLYELATGHLPFEVEGDYLRMIAQLQQVPAAPSTHNPGLPPGLDLIVARALQKEPEDRFATSGEFRDALEELEREHGVLRPYGTPAAGTSPVPGTGKTRASSGTIPAVGAPVGASPQSVPGVPTSSAVLTPADTATSITPVPFSIEPASATPIDLYVPIVRATVPEPSAPDPAIQAEAATLAKAALPTPEFTVAQTAAVPPARSGLSRGVLAGVGVVAVVAAGVLLSRNVSAREKIAADTLSTASVPALTPAPMPTQVVTTGAVDTAAGRTAVVTDSATLKLVADSLRLARKARTDSIRARRDSLAAASSPADELEGAKRAVRSAAAECVSALNSHDGARVEALFGTRYREILRIVREGQLVATGPLGTMPKDVEADRAQAEFRVTLGWTNGKGENREVGAAMRVVAERTGGVWKTMRCLVDNDGGARF